MAKVGAGTKPAAVTYLLMLLSTRSTIAPNEGFFGKSRESNVKLSRSSTSIIRSTIKIESICRSDCVVSNDSVSGDTSKRSATKLFKLEKISSRCMVGSPEYSRHPTGNDGTM